MSKNICLLIAMCLLITAGCARTSQAPTEKPASITFTDSRGYQITLKEKPRRIVSLFPSTDEILLELVNHSRILALSKWSRDVNFSNVVEEAKKIPLIAESSPEFLLKEKADLVITRQDMGQNPGMLKILNEMGIPVYVFKGPSNIEEVRKLILELGQVTGEKEQAEKIVGKMNSELSNIKKEIGVIPDDKRKTALIWTGRGIVGGKNLMTHDILENAQVKDGADNFDAPPGSSLSKETVVKIDPDIIMVIGLEYNENTAENIIGEIMGDSGLQTVKAVKNKNVIIMPLRYTSNSSQYVVNAVREVSRAVYGK